MKSFKVCFLGIIVVYFYSVKEVFSLITPSTVASGTNLSTIYSQYERTTWFDGTYWWAFYSDGSQIRVRYSQDGQIWNNPSSGFATGSNNPNLGFSVWLSGNTFYLVWGYQRSSPLRYYLRWKSGIISGTGITWGIINTVYSASTLVGQSPSFVVGTNGDCYDTDIEYCSATECGTNGYYVFVDRYASCNFNSQTYWYTSYYSNNGTNNGTTLIPLSDGQIVNLFHLDNQFYARIYNPITNSWSSYSLGPNDISLSNVAFSAVLGNSNYLYAVYLDLDNNLKIVRYDSATNSWDSPILVDSTPASSPTITYRPENNTLDIFWIKNGNIYGRTYLISSNSFTNIEQLTDAGNALYLSSLYQSVFQDGLPYVTLEWSVTDESTIYYYRSPSPTPIILLYFKASLQKEKDKFQVFLEWETGEEIGIIGYDLYRCEENNCQQINPELIFASSEIMGAYYSFLDKDVEKGKTYIYKLLVREATGQDWFKLSGQIKIDEEQLNNENLPRKENTDESIKISLSCYLSKGQETIPFLLFFITPSLFYFIKRRKK